MKLSSRAYALFQAFSLPGCPICRLTLDSVHHYLDGMVYEHFNKPYTHETVRAARGFCPTHAWHIQDELNASAFPIAVLYEGVIRTLVREMGSTVPLGDRRQVSQAASALKPQGLCPACVHQATVEEHLIRNLLDHLDRADFANGLRQSAGLCLPHLRQALEGPGDASPKALLVAIHKEVWTRLQDELAEFIRKHDYRFAEEDMGDEGSSPRRAIEQMAGAKGLR